MRAYITALILFLLSSPLFAKTVDGHWHVGIGDPTFFGWVTVVFYLIASCLSFRQYRRIKQADISAVFWLGLAGLLFLLAINKQLDLQTFFTEVMREHALSHGWYENRRSLQLGFLTCLAAGFVAVLLWLRVALARSWRQFRLAWLGIMLLCTFVLMRAASFHHFDQFIGTELLGLKWNVILEIGALLILMIAALRHPTETSKGAPSRQVDNYVEVATIDDKVYCPSCQFRALSSTVHGRVFKCKRCGHKYTLFVTHH